MQLFSVIPQALGKTSSPTFAGLTITGNSVFGLNSSVFQPNTDSTTFFQVLDADGGTPIFNIDSTNERAGFGNNAPTTTLDVTGTGTFVDVNITDEDVAYQLGGATFLRGNSTDNNVFIGFGSGVNSGGSSSQNVGIGHDTLGTLTSGVDNVVIGERAGRDLTTGTGNVALGRFSLLRTSTGSNNFALGNESLTNNRTHSGNIGIGDATLQTLNGGEKNIAIGQLAMKFATSAKKNVVIGEKAGRDLTTGSSNVFIGIVAGVYQTTNSNLLIIDNQDRGNAAGELTNALIYGIFSATPASQSLRFNIGTTTWHNATHEDSDGGRKSQLNFKGQQSGGEETTLARIEVSHDGAADDEKGKVEIYVNDGDDGDSPTLAATIDSSLDAFFAKIKLTAIGGYAIKLTNKTGANSVAGELVNAHTSVENAVEQTAIDDLIPIGAFLDSGITDGSEAWVVVGGIAQVLVDGSTTVAVGDWVKVSSNDAGRCESSGSHSPGINHFREIVHALEGGGNNELVKIAMHFN